MQAPKKKTSKSKRNMRRSHHKVSTSSPILCSNCGELVIPHRVCRACGYYKGKLVLKRLEQKEVEEDQAA